MPVKFTMFLLPEEIRGALNSYIVKKLEESIKREVDSIIGKIPLIGPRGKNSTNSSDCGKLSQVQNCFWAIIGKIPLIGGSIRGKIPLIGGYSWKNSTNGEDKP